MTDTGETQDMPHVTVYRRNNGPFEPAVRYCLGCRFVTSGAEDAMRRSAERHEAEHFGRNGES